MKTSMMSQLLVLPVVMTIGCGSGVLEGENGLTLTAASAGAGLTGEFRRGDGVIYFDASRASTSEPMVASFTDSQGRLVATTGEAVKEGTGDTPSVTDPVQQARLLDLVGAAAVALAREELSGVDEERDALVDLARGAVDSEELEAIPPPPSRSAMSTSLAGKGIPCSVEPGLPYLSWINGVRMVNVRQWLKCSTPVKSMIAGDLMEDYRYQPDLRLASRGYTSSYLLRSWASWTIRGACRKDGSGRSRYGRFWITLPTTSIGGVLLGGVTVRGSNRLLNCPL